MSTLEKTPRAHKAAAYFHDAVNFTLLLSKKHGSFAGLFNKIAELALALLEQLLGLQLFGGIPGRFLRNELTFCNNLIY